MRPRAGTLVAVAGLAASALAQDAQPYRWRGPVAAPDTVAARIPPPPGHRRRDAAPGSFGAWLRGLPLKPGRPAVLLYDGRRKGNQEAHHAVVDIDTGTRDLQQCADAVMRLRAEYLLARGDASAVGFRFTSGHPALLARWFEGQRPRVQGSRVDWAPRAAPDASYASFRRYLDVVFTYAGSASLVKELDAVPATDIQPGDVFIQGGFPGHAVLVIDVADGPAGRSAFLLAQSYMPAQDIHVLRNPRDPAGGAWYDAAFGDVLETPEWTFRRADLRRFAAPRR
jgi:hypothetical protein